MNAFPFTSADWQRVKDAAEPMVRARLADDDVLADSLFFGLQETLHDLRHVYGDHPVLLETEADFADEPDERIRLYADALELATANRLPTTSICLAFARVLLENGRETGRAGVLLKWCRPTVLASSDETVREEYQELAEMLAMTLRVGK